ncbi:MAG TPA: hypothetical protein VJT75_15760 [Thermoleophilaceae bacterium]|nr:hypothetical protein [Thermoleophilaceae bacterium]
MPPQQAFGVGLYSQVFVAKRHGGASRVTGRPGVHRDPAWSPSGNLIAMATGRAVEIRSPSGRIAEVIEGGGESVAWAPDERRIALLVTPRHGPNYNLVVADLRSESRDVVAHDVSGRPSWSADGRTLFYLRTRSLGTRYGRTGLFAVPARGGTPRRLAANAESCTEALPSPTGRWVLFGRGSDLWVVRPDGSGERRLIRSIDCPEPPTYDPPPSYGWTLNGRAVYGGRSEDGRPTVRTLAGGRAEPGVRFSGEQYAMSLDGRRVAWLGRYGRTLRSARTDGRDRLELARFESSWGDPDVDVRTLAWSPDGRRLAIEALRDDDP